MRPALAVWIKDSIAVDDFMVSIFKQWKIEVPGKSLLYLLHKLFRIFVAVDADREYLNLLFFVLV